MSSAIGSEGKTISKTATPVAELDALCEVVPSRPMLWVGDSRYSFGEISNTSWRLASSFVSSSVRSGDRVALHLPNGAEMVAALFACWRIGAIAVPVSGLLKPVELKALLRTLTPALYLGGIDGYPAIASAADGLLPAARRFVVGAGCADLEASSWENLLTLGAGRLAAREIDSEAPALLIGTSGTTGEVKQVVHTGRTLAAIGASSRYRALDRPEVLLGMLPMAHISGTFMIMSALFSGSALALPPTASPEDALDTIERRQCTWAAGIPARWSAIVRSQRTRPRDLSSLRFAISGGDVLPTGLEAEAEEVLGTPLRCFWASSEDVAAMTVAHSRGRSARPIPDAEVRLVDAKGRPVAAGTSGELLVRSPTTSPGYWLAPERLDPLPDGWFHSGDLMRWDGDDLLFIGRAKDLIVHNAYKIAPAEVEAVLLDCDGVVDCGVAGISDEVVGQRVVAALVLEETLDRSALEGIRGEAAARLAEYKVPDGFRLVAAVPRNALGKVDRHAIAQMFDNVS